MYLWITNNTYSVIAVYVLASKQQVQVLLFGTFWNFFSLNIFHFLLVESADVEPARFIECQLSLSS